MNSILRYFLPGVAAMLLGHFAFGFLGSTVAIVAFCLLLIYRIHKQTGLFLNHISGIYALSVILTSLANVEIWSLFNNGIFLTSYRYARMEFFEEAQLLWGIGNIAIFSGMLFQGKRLLPVIQYELSEKYYPWMFYVSLALSFKSLWLTLELPGALGNIVDLVPLLIILFFARLSYEKESRKLMVWAIILTATKTLVAIMFSYLRSEMALPLVILALGVYVGAGSLKPFLSYKALPFYGFVLVFFAFFQLFGDNRSGLVSGWSRLTQIQDVAKNNEPWGGIENKLTPFQRLSSVGQLSAEIGKVHDNGLYNGEASAPLLTALIPRFLWPEKPTIAMGVWFALLLDEALQTETWYNNSINMTIPGELYLDFGWLGVILGGLLVGWLVDQWWQSSVFMESATNFTGAIFGGYLLNMALLGLGADLQMLITTLAIYLILLVASKILNVTGQKNSLHRSTLAGK